MSEDESGPLVICLASDIEADPFLKADKLTLNLTKREHEGKMGSSFFPLSIYTGKINDSKNLYHENFLFVVTGIGKEPAIQSAKWIAEQKPKLTLNIGFAGGLNPSLKVADFVIPAEIKNLSGEKISCNNWAHFPKINASGALLTSETIIHTSGEKASLSSAADAVDMESFYLGSVMQSYHIPFYCIKIISDTSGESFPVDFSKAVKNGKIIPLKAILLILQKLPGIPFSMKFAIRSSQLSKKLYHFVFSDGTIFK